MAEIFVPALTALELPIGEMGRIGTELLIGQLTGGSRAPTQVCLPATLVVRHSSGPCVRRTPAARRPRPLMHSAEG